MRIPFSGCLFGLILLASAGCVSQSAVDEPNYSDTVAEYRLVAIDGKRLPFDLAFGTVVSGSLRLTTSGAFVDEITYHSSGHDSPQLSTGLYEASGESIELKYADSRPAVFDTVATNGDTLTKRHCSVILLCAPDMKPLPLRYTRR